MAGNQAKLAEAWVKVLLSFDGMAESLRSSLDNAIRSSVPGAVSSMETQFKSAGQTAGQNFAQAYNASMNGLTNNQASQLVRQQVQDVQAEIQRLQNEQLTLGVTPASTQQLQDAQDLLNNLNQEVQRFDQMSASDLQLTFDSNASVLQQQLNQTQLTVPLQANTQQLQQQLNTNPANLPIQANAQPAMANVSSQINSAAPGIGSSAGAAIGTAMAAGFAALKVGEYMMNQVTAGLEQQGLNDVTAAALNLSEAQAEKIAKISSDLFAGAYGESYEEVQSAMRAIVGSTSEGADASAEELEKMGRDVLNLSKVYGLSSEEILKSTQSQLSGGFASSWDEAISNVTGGFQTMGANGDDFFESLNEYATSFKGLGLTGQQTLNLFNASLDAGARNTDVLSDALREVQIRMGDESSFEALDALGFDPQEIKAKFAAGGDAASEALQDVWTRLQQEGDKDLFAQIFGTQSEDYFEVFQNIDLSSFNDQLAEGVGDMEKFDELINGGINTSLESFKNLISQAFIELLQPALELITPLLSDFVTFLQENEAAAAAIAIIIGGVFLAAVIALGVALWGLVAPVLANPITWIILAAVAAVGLLVAAVWAIAENWDFIMASISAAFGAFVSFISSAVSAVGEAFASVFTGIGNFFIGFVNIILSCINLIIQALNSIQWTAPEWMGGFEIGFNLPELKTIPKLARGGVVNPGPGGEGALALLAEANRPEAVVDEGLLNAALAQGLSGTNNSSDAGGLVINIYQQPGQSSEELVTLIADEYDFNSSSANMGYGYQAP